MSSDNVPSLGVRKNALILFKDEEWVKFFSLAKNKFNDRKTNEKRTSTT